MRFNEFRCPCEGIVPQRLFPRVEFEYRSRFYVEQPSEGGHNNPTLGSQQDRVPPRSNDHGTVVVIVTLSFTMIYRSNYQCRSNITTVGSELAASVAPSPTTRSIKPAVSGNIIHYVCFKTLDLVPEIESSASLQNRR